MVSRSLLIFSNIILIAETSLFMLLSCEEWLLQDSAQIRLLLNISATMSSSAGDKGFSW